MCEAKHLMAPQYFWIYVGWSTCTCMYAQQKLITASASTRPIIRITNVYMCARIMLIVYNTSIIYTSTWTLLE